MRGFLAGVLFTVVVGGFFYHLHFQYDTMSACTALRGGLKRAVMASVQAEVRQRLGQDVPKGLGEVLLQPLTEPIVTQRVEAYVADKSWFGCAYDLVRLDLFGGRALIDEIRSVTLRL